MLDWWALLLLAAFLQGGAGTKAAGAENSMTVNGTLEGSVTFKLANSHVLSQVIWFKSATNIETSIVVILKPTSEQCESNIWNSAFKGRLDVSKDCKQLELRNLNRDDSGSYMAEMQQPVMDGADSLKESFHLKVYKRLSGADLKIQCDKIGNETMRLKCSVGPKEDDVRMSWNNSTKEEISGNSIDLDLTGNDPEQNLICMARNPVSNAYRTVFLNEVCKAPAGNKGNVGRTVGIIVGVILLLVLVVIITWFCRKKRKAGRWKYPDSAETEEQSKTIYAEVENVPTVVGIEEPRRGGKPVKMEKEKIQTIYTTVDHCKPSPLQTDDEKMRKGRRPPPKQVANVTYVEISAPQESEDRGIKSIYDTVKNPQIPGGTEYNVNI